MKTNFLRFALPTLALSTLLFLNSSAQNSNPASTSSTAPANKAQAQKPAMDEKKGETKEPHKDEFVKRLNEIQPKVNDLNAKAKENGSKDAEFSAEASKLNTMVNDFRSKVDRWDSTPQDQRHQYSESLQKDWDVIKAQHSKVEGMWNKKHPNKSEQKETQKKSSQK